MVTTRSSTASQAPTAEAAAGRTAEAAPPVEAATMATPRQAAADPPERPNVDIEAKECCTMKGDHCVHPLFSKILLQSVEKIVASDRLPQPPEAPSPKELDEWLENVWKPACQEHFSGPQTCEFTKKQIKLFKKELENNGLETYVKTMFKYDEEGSILMDLLTFKLKSIEHSINPNNSEPLEYKSVAGPNGWKPAEKGRRKFSNQVAAFGYLRGGIHPGC
jgi:hypothetical protein